MSAAHTILREWFGAERYARDYEYLDANFMVNAKRVAALDCDFWGSPGHERDRMLARIAELEARLSLVSREV